MGNKQDKKSKTKQLTEKELDVITANSQLSREDIQKWHKQFLTEFPDGYIREAQFVKIFKELYNHGHPEKFAKFAFSAFDQDHNGKIGFDEFIIATSFLIKQGATREQEQERLNLAFSIFDINHDGKIDKNELTKLYKAIADVKGQDDKQAKQKVTDVLKQYDKDNNGSLNKQEFVQALQNEDVFNFFK